MQVNFSFNNAKVYDSVKADVILSETFTVELETEQEGLRWFSDNDSVLNIQVAADAKSAIIDTKQVGNSEIQIQNTQGAVVQRIFLKIYSNEAVKLNPTASTPQIKSS